MVAEKHFVLAGTPNAGKTSIFNMLTGRNQKVGNWPGVTVESAWGYINQSASTIKITDLPGTYNLNPDSDDQKIAGEFITNGEYDLIINVVDATSLSHNLYLTLEILKRTKRVVVFLNMMDVAKKEGILIDHNILSQELGIPVIPVVAIDSVSVDKAFQKMCGLYDRDIFSGYFYNNRKMDISSIYNEVDRIFGLSVTYKANQESITSKVDAIVLNRYLSIPIFLLTMYTVFWFAICGGSIFIDFFDSISGLIFIDLLAYGLEYINSPPWIITILADGLGSGIQTVATFVPVVFFLFLAIGVIEDLGYLSRISVISDRIMRKIGLPGNAFLPMIIGLGCTVPAVMACRTLKSRRDRYMTIFLTPFMSCGARIPVYALFGGAFFRNYTGPVVFSLYLSGVLMAIFTGLLLKKTLFPGTLNPLIIELPKYHVPRPLPIIRNAANRIGFFIKRAGKVLVLAVFILTLLNSIYLGKSDKSSILTSVAKAVTPVFHPLGISDDNWPATVALFSGLFAKESIVGTINSLYSQSDVTREEAEREPLFSLISETLTDGVISIGAGVRELFTSADLLGISVVNGSEEDLEVELETDVTVFVQLRRNFTPYSAYAYLLFVLLYFPCLAVVGAAKQEMGQLYAFLMVLYSTVLAWSVSTLFYQLTEGRNLIYALSAIGALTAIFITFKIIGSTKKMEVNR